LIAIALGTLSGTAGRLLFLRVDYRAYPSYPHAYTAHLAFGFLASLVGAVAPVALAAEQYDAVTFLLLVATQFREIREMERNKLSNLETIELVPRGANYIEGIAEVFELRNYLIMLVGAGVAGVTLLWETVPGAVSGVALLLLASWIRSDLRLSNIADIQPAPINFKGVELFVGDVHIMNIALRESREKIEKYGVGLTLTARDDEFLGVLDNMGQRQAVVHDLIHVLGNREDVDSPELKPQVRKDLSTQKVGVYFCPVDPDMDRVLVIASNVPVISNARRGSGEGL